MKLLTTKFSLESSIIRDLRPNCATDSNEWPLCAVVHYLSHLGPVYPGWHWSHCSCPPLLKWQVGLKLMRLPSSRRRWSCCPSVVSGWRRKSEKRRKQRRVRAIICLTAYVHTAHTLQRVPLPSLSSLRIQTVKHTQTHWGVYIHNQIKLNSPPEP